jgi:hypothetical protein
MRFWALRHPAQPVIGKRPSAVGFRVLVAVAACAVGPLCAERASAQRLLHPALHWSRGRGAEACIDPRSLAERIESITGPSLVAASVADVSIEAHIEQPASDRFALRVTVTQMRDRGSGERFLSFTTSDCRSLDRAIALVIAVLIDPDAGSEGLPAELSWLQPEETSAAEQLREQAATLQPKAAASRDASRAQPAAGRDPQQPSTSESPREAPDAMPWQLSVGIFAGSGPGRVASAGLLAALARKFLPWLAIGVQLRAAGGLLPLNVEGSRSVTTQNLGLSLLACPHAALGTAWHVRGCLGPELMLLFASGHGFSSDETAVLGSFGASARLALEHRFAATWGLAALGLLQWDAAPPSVHYQRGGESTRVFTVPAVTLQAALAITYEF